MKTSEIISTVAHLSDILQAYKDVMALPDCNTCATKNTCRYSPPAGSMVRINCFAHIKRESEMTNDMLQNKCDCHTEKDNASVCESCMYDMPDIGFAGVLSRNDPHAIFISQPMNGKSNDEIEIERLDAIKYIRMIYPRATFPNTWVSDIQKEVNNDGLYCLGKSLEIMSRCDGIYMVNGWQNARGCRIERQIAAEYGLIEIPSGLIETGA